ncbi:hypothetical protein [Actinokineospora globicatena]|uniref:hypothetical protein n=1 Tax=Actinokineospora globicatena TaxID=103729 RepID=UPI0020A36432|nr:hypothetical protein [Actinokineospora globicatena]MCP2306681.1 hypothetical protein [Actinokineospora globicatena]GLW82204.1 hypothetical protein Aglo01_66850 [Actinokineospora globicatena]GLW88997.1 hypothetical protein Aglo02_66360 [Actinokineospora globicatena]
MFADDRRATWERSHRVCVVIRTRTDLSRMLDVLRALDGDPRLDFYWTINEGSRFAGGARERLARLDVQFVEWGQARSMVFDLIIAAHSDGALGELVGPVVTMAHGTGYNRRVLWRTEDADSPAGLSAKELTRGERVVAAAIGLSCESQVDQLSMANPHAVPRAFQMGDPTWDRMVANVDMRESFRRELGIGAHHRLIGISSTWGPDSTLGVDHLVVNRVVAALPHDEYRVVLILHPNVWTHHTGFGVRGLFGDAIEAGLVIVLPTTDWPAPLIAVDAFIGDHGSVSVYAAALGRPFLFAGRGDDELVKGSTTLDFVRAAGRLDAAADLRAQIVDAMRRYARSGVAEVARRAMGSQGRSLRLLQAKFYELMALDPPPQVPHPRRYSRLRLVRDDHGVTAFHCHPTLTVRPDCTVTVSVERYPAVLAEHRSPAHGGGAAVLVVDEHESNHQLKESAEVRVCGDDRDAAAVWGRITRTLLDSPCFLAAGVNGSRLLVGTRLGGRWDVRRVGGVPIDPGALAAAVYQLAVEPGRELSPSGVAGRGVSTVEVQVGAMTSTIAITRVSANAHSP